MEPTRPSTDREPQEMAQIREKNQRSERMKADGIKRSDLHTDQSIGEGTQRIEEGREWEGTARSHLSASGLVA